MAGRSDQIAILNGSDRDREKKDRSTDRNPAPSISFFKIFICFIAFFKSYYISRIVELKKSRIIKKVENLKHRVKVAIFKRYRTVLRTVPFCTVPWHERMNRVKKGQIQKSQKRLFQKIYMKIWSLSFYLIFFKKSTLRSIISQRIQF